MRILPVPRGTRYRYIDPFAAPQLRCEDVRRVHDYGVFVARCVSRSLEEFLILRGDEDGCCVRFGEGGCERDELADVRETKGAPVAAVVCGRVRSGRKI